MKPRQKLKFKKPYMLNGIMFEPSKEFVFIQNSKRLDDEYAISINSLDYGGLVEVSTIKGRTFETLKRNNIL